MTLMEKPTANRQIARAASTVMLAFIISNLIGLVRQIVIAHAFGTGSDVEAFNAANRVAEVLVQPDRWWCIGIRICTDLYGFAGKRRQNWRLETGQCDSKPAVVHPDNGRIFGSHIRTGHCSTTAGARF